MTPDISRRDFILVGSAAAGAGLAYLTHEEPQAAPPAVGGSTSGRGGGSWLHVTANEIRSIDVSESFNGVTVESGGSIRFEVGESLTITGGD